MDIGALISGKVIWDKYKPSPLFHGGLDVPINVFVSWSNEKSMTILEEKVKSTNYPCNMDCVDVSDLGRAWKNTKKKWKYARHKMW